MKTRNHSSAFYIIRDAVIAVALSAAAAECYAVEGFYPDNIGYLIENYDLHIDKNSCIVHYSPISSNIMPDIKVIAK